VKNKKPSTQRLRHPKAYVSAFGTNSVHLRNPWVTVCWSFAFPGLGHVIMGRYAKGFILIIWELVINMFAKINLAIMYSFTGRFEMAKDVMDQRWLLLYAAVYVYAIWDSYRSTVDLNKYAILAERDGADVVPFKMNALEINYFDKRNPWVAPVWSGLMPGLGHLYCHRLSTGFFVIIWWIAIAYYSHLLEAVHLTMTGSFSQATAVLDPQWLLFLPSLYGFTIYDSYSHTVEYNKMFEYEQAKYLRHHYQDPEFKMPV